MKKILKIPLFLLLLSFGIYFVYSCQDDLEEDAVGFGIKPKLTINYKHTDSLFLSKPNLKKMLNFITVESRNKKLTSPIYNFSIDEHLVQEIEHEDYTTYTFKIERTNPTPNLLENYMVVITGGNVTIHYLLQYPYQTDPNTGEKIFNSNASSFVLENPNWIQKSIATCPPGTVPELIDTSIVYVSFAVACSGGGHNPGDPSCECGKTSSCTPGYYTYGTTTVYNWGCGGGGYLGGSSSSSGSSGTNTTTTVPFDDIEDKDPKDECKRIKQFLIDNPIFKDSLVALAATAATATAENALTLQSNGTQNSHAGSAGVVEVDQNPNKSYVAVAHIHNGLNTYSIFSNSDLRWVGQVGLLNNKIDSRKFISFLATGKGTYYAFTINNSKKFYDFFQYVKFLKPGITPTELGNYLKLAKEKEDLTNKYYEGENPKIKEDSPVSAKENELREFMHLLKTGDIGISLFETDASFTNFTPLNNDLGFEVVRQPCNN